MRAIDALEEAAERGPILHSRVKVLAVHDRVVQHLGFRLQVVLIVLGEAVVVLAEVGEVEVL